MKIDGRLKYSQINENFQGITGLNNFIGKINTLIPHDLEGNKLDWTTHNMNIGGDDSITQLVNLNHKRRTSKLPKVTNPTSMNKVRRMLNKNINMNKRRENNGENSRAAKMKRLVAALSGSPSNRRVFSNIKERTQESTLEIKENRIKSRAFSPNATLRRNEPIDNEMKQKLNLNLDYLMK